MTISLAWRYWPRRRGPAAQMKDDGIRFGQAPRRRFAGGFNILPYYAAPVIMSTLSSLHYGAGAVTHADIPAQSRLQVLRAMILSLRGQRD